jgi:hypothetical protein
MLRKENLVMSGWGGWGTVHWGNAKAVHKEEEYQRKSRSEGRINTWILDEH